MANVISLDGYVYRNTGTYGSPTWNHIPNIRDLTTTANKTKADVSNRVSKYRQSRGTMRDLDLTFGMVYDPADADMDALHSAWLNDTQIDLLVLDGPIGTPGSAGWRAVYEVFKFERTENLEEGMMVEIEMAPSYSSNAPGWYEAV